MGLFLHFKLKRATVGAALFILQVFNIHIVAPAAEVEVLAPPFNLSALEVHCFAAQMVLCREEVSGIVAVHIVSVGINTSKVEM